MSEVVEYQRLRIEALTAELQRLQLLLNEVSEISTAKARDIKVLIADPIYNEPIKK